MLCLCKSLRKIKIFKTVFFRKKLFSGILSNWWDRPSDGYSQVMHLPKWRISPSNAFGHMMQFRGLKRSGKFVFKGLKLCVQVPSTYNVDKFARSEGGCGPSAKVMCQSDARLAKWRVLHFLVSDKCQETKIVAVYQRALKKSFWLLSDC